MYLYWVQLSKVLTANVDPMDWIGGTYWIAAIGDWIVTNTDNHRNNWVGDTSISQGPYTY